MTNFAALPPPKTASSSSTEGRRLRLRLVPAGAATMVPPSLSQRKRAGGGRPDPPKTSRRSSSPAAPQMRDEDGGAAIPAARAGRARGAMGSSLPAQGPPAGAVSPGVPLRAGPGATQTDRSAGGVGVGGQGASRREVRWASHHLGSCQQLGWGFVFWRGWEREIGEGEILFSAREGRRRDGQKGGAVFTDRQTDSPPFLV